MSKTNTIFTCSNCGAQFQKWSGRCLECGKWGSVKEETQYTEHGTNNNKTAKQNNYKPATVTPLSDVQGQNIIRTKTDILELDRVLGGGIVPGSLILLGGEPGIGKSTLALQIALIISNTLYISGEESIGQVKLRSDRLKLKTSNLKLANETNIETVCATITKNKPSLVIIDSIQTMYSDEVDGGAGNPNQIRACTIKLLETAKNENIAIIIIGHVTKDGTVAGPKTLEHMVDTVLYFEGEHFHTYRLLRAVKNRFGATDEVGVFEMTEQGLNEVKNPSATFLAERGENTPGNVITCLIEGTRPILVEVQALINKTSFGYPIRKSSGFDLNRLHVLTAVLQKRAGLNLAQYDIHLNIVGGIEANEPAADLAVCLAIASAYKDKSLGIDLCVFGEVGLGGEVRSVNQTEKRLHECEKLGLKRVITHSKKDLPAIKIKLIDVKNIQELVKSAD